MKKILQKNVGAIIVIGMLCSLILSCVLQINMIQEDMVEDSQVLFHQIHQILDENTIESEKVKNEYRDMCLLKAEAAAYIIQDNRTGKNTQEKLKKVARLLEVDELHLFNTQGQIFAGTNPEYYGFSFHSGEQIGFFLPMLKDHTLKLCQEAMPNTAEKKIMQYAAVWREDGQGIVQIGMEPTRLLRIMSKNELSYIFSLLAGRDGETLYAVDAKTDQIVGSTDKALVGKSLEEIGLKQKKLSGLTAQKPFYVKLGGAWHYGIFADMNDVLVGRVCSVKSLYQEVYKNAGIFFFCFMLVSVLIVLNVFHYLDRKIIRGMTRVNDKVQSIANGNFDETVDVDTTPEFIKLSQNINRMVKRILGNTDKLSSILDQVEMPIGVYEYNLAMKRVQITNKIPEIFGWSNEETKNVVSDYHLFEEHLDKVRKNPVYENKNHIFQVEDGSVRYIKLESYVRDNSFFGILSDVTNEIVEQKKLEEERDQDLLTGLCNRRGYYARLEKLFRKPEELKYAVLIMIDTDNLKKINDTYGHDAGDSYLCGMMQVLKLCTAPQQIQARLSGDEFSLFIYGCSSEEELQQYIEELQQKQGGYDILFQNRLHMSVKFSMGSAFYPMDGDDYVGMLKYADDRMYEDKRRRKEKEKRVQAE